MINRLSVPFGVKALAFAVLALGSGGLLAQTPAPPLAPLALKGHAEHGRKLAETCNGCHAIPGYRNVYPSFHVPKLGGQNADYIEIALQGYRRGTRGHDTMHAQAAKLSDQDIADIAAYFASVENSPEPGISRATEEMIQAGKEKSAVCTACHGETGMSPLPQYPNLAGQHESYLKRALTQYKTGEREDLVMAPMAAPLDETAIEELAVYFAAQSGLYTPEAM